MWKLPRVVFLFTAVKILLHKVFCNLLILLCVENDNCDENSDASNLN